MDDMDRAMEAFRDILRYLGYDDGRGESLRWFGESVDRNYLMLGGDLASGHDPEGCHNTIDMEIEAYRRLGIRPDYSTHSGKTTIDEGWRIKTSGCKLASAWLAVGTKEEIAKYWTWLRESIADAMRKAEPCLSVDAFADVQFKVTSFYAKGNDLFEEGHASNEVCGRCWHIHGNHTTLGRFCPAKKNFGEKPPATPEEARLILIQMARELGILKECFEV